MKNLFTVLLSLFLSTNSYSELPAFNNYVNDLADMLSSPTKESLNQTLAAFEKQTGNQLAVLTIPSLDGRNLEAFANAVFNEWKIGQTNYNNGVLLLISKSDRKLRIEVGYGLESELTDGEAGRIIRNIITPEFRKGDYDAGIIRGIKSIQEEIQGFIGIPEKEPTTSPPTFLLLFAGIVLIIFIVIAWRKYKRNKARVSKKTGEKMFRLSEAEEDVFLSNAQQLEENLGSVDYDVWVTANRGEYEVIAYNAFFSSYSVCHKCDAKAVKLTDNKIVSRASYYHSGKGIKTYTCLHCHHEQEEHYRIPKKVKRPRVRRRGNFTNGSFSWTDSYTNGGGFSGGGSSSFFSDSFSGGGGGFSGGGGGFSGGGGASGSW